MDKQRVKGAIDQVVGSARRHIGNPTGDTETQVGGAVQQIKGKVETAVGKLKDSAREASDKANARNEADEKVQREKRLARLAKNHNLLVTRSTCWPGATVVESCLRITRPRPKVEQERSNDEDRWNTLDHCRSGGPYLWRILLYEPKESR